MQGMSETGQNQPLQQTPNSDIVNLPGSGRDVQEGVTPLSPTEQAEQLSNFFEDNYPEIFRSLTTDEGYPYTSKGQDVPAELKESTERMWAKVPDLLTHTGLLVLGAGLDHGMPHASFVRTGPRTEELELPESSLPEGVRGTVLRPSQPNGAVAVSLHGGPGWFGDGLSHEQFWLPLFAALAERSGVTVVDLIYPLPGGSGDWEPTQAAVSRAAQQAFAAVCEAEDTPRGLITFGTGFVAGRDLFDQVDFHLMMTPRIPKGFAAPAEHACNFVSVAALDTRGTPAAEVRRWMDACGADYEYGEYASEHIIAAPTVWRERVEEAARWLDRQARGISEAQ